MLALFAQLGSIAHLALVKHVTCAEHGEMIDVVDQSGKSVAAVDSRPAESRIGLAETPAHGHDHCPLAAFRRQRIVARAHARPAPLPSSNPHCFAFETRLTPARAIALLDVAPKISPPLA
jgi:hypothetical protein